MAKSKYSNEQWNEIKNLIELGDMSIKEASQRMGLQYNLVRNKAMRDKWMTKARKKLLTEKDQFEPKKEYGKYEIVDEVTRASKALEDKILETKAKWQTENIDRNQRLAKCVDNTMDQMDDLIDPDALVKIVKAKNEINRDQRDALGLANTPEASNFNQIAIITSPIENFPKEAQNAD